MTATNKAMKLSVAQIRALMLLNEPDRFARGYLWSQRDADVGVLSKMQAIIGWNTGDRINGKTFSFLISNGLVDSTGGADRTWVISDRGREAFAQASVTDKIAAAQAIALDRAETLKRRICARAWTAVRDAMAERDIAEKAVIDALRASGYVTTGLDCNRLAAADAVLNDLKLEAKAADDKPVEEYITEESRIAV